MQPINKPNFELHSSLYNKDLNPADISYDTQKFYVGTDDSVHVGRAKLAGVRAAKLHNVAEVFAKTLTNTEQLKNLNSKQLSTLIKNINNLNSKINTFNDHSIFGKIYNLIETGTWHIDPIKKDQLELLQKQKTEEEARVPKQVQAMVAEKSSGKKNVTPPAAKAETAQTAPVKKADIRVMDKQLTNFDEELRAVKTRPKEKSEFLNSYYELGQKYLQYNEPKKACICFVGVLCNATKDVALFTKTWKAFNESLGPAKKTPAFLAEVRKSIFAEFDQTTPKEIQQLVRLYS